MKVLHIMIGGDKGGAKTHVSTLMSALMEEINVTIVFITGGTFYQEALEKGIPAVLMKQKFRNDLSVVKKLVKHIREEKYDLIHTHGARANFIAMFLRPFIKIPIITTIHSDYELDFTGSIYKKLVYTGLNKLALKKMDYYIGVSNSFKEMLVSRGFSVDKIYTVYNAVDFDKTPTFVSREEFLKRYNINAENKTIVGIIGRFDLVKGHEVFVNAAAEILKKRDDVIFLLAGEGPEQKNLEEQATRLGIRQNLVFTGFVQDIFSFINAIDINALSSYSESFTYALLEGAMMKKATVTTDVGGLSDLIKSGETGFLAAPSDHVDLAEKILKFIEGKELRGSLGENLYNFAKENFSKESMKKTHVDIYKSVIDKQKAENKRFDVILSGYYGFGNSGDDAILKSIIQSLRAEKEDIKILVFSRKPAKIAEEHGVFAVNRHNFFKIIKYMKRSRLFLYGGGSLIQDITSTKSLLYYTFLLDLAKRFGLKLMIYAGGIGPITKEKNFKRARRAIEICDYISLREPESMNVIEELKAKNDNVHISIDPVLNLKMEQNDNALEMLDHSKKYFTISLRKWKLNAPDFCEKMAKIIDYISEKHDIIPLYVAMQQSDYEIIREVAEKTACEYVILKEIYEVGKLMSIISKTQLVISMRLHTLIYAVSGDVPIVGLVYDPKVKNFIEYLNEKYYVNTTDFNENKVLEIVDEIYKHYDDVVCRIGKRSEELKALSRNDAKEVIRLVDM
ncbi:MAG: polysaccharide pyruvyl transferase CsaB [Defluviitaleaceae bacterium]|nr:polysaccharide pyruvyl transferase CsaB [Defluviitaleaceae bacterium]